MAKDSPPSSSSSSASTTISNENPATGPPKKKGRKKKKVKPEIPTNLTASIGENRRKELQSEPEVFEKTTKPKKVSAETSSTGESLILTASAQSLPKQPFRPSKLVYEQSKDQVIEYNIDVGRTYSQSSGTLSYDSVFVADEAKMNTFKATGVNAKTVEVKVQTSKIVDLNAQQQIEQTIPFEEGEYQKLIHGTECPLKALPTPGYLYGRREKQLAKETIMEAIEEYFSNDRDDLNFNLNIQRRGPFPTVSIKIAPNPLTNPLSTLTASTEFSSSNTNLVSTSEEASTAKSIKSVISQTFDYLLGVICKKSS